MTFCQNWADPVQSREYSVSMKKLNAGFTLVELLVTLAIVAILAAVAVPSFQEMTARRSMTAQVSEFSSTFALARNQATTEVIQVTVCSSDDGLTCSGNSRWENGWIAFLDVNENETPEFGTQNCLPAEDCLIKVKEALPQGVTITATNDWVAFSGLGELIPGSATSAMLCAMNADTANDTDKSRTFSMAASGSVSVDKGTTSCP